MDNQSIQHTRWNCTYHIVFIPKYRRYSEEVMRNETDTAYRRKSVQRSCTYVYGNTTEVQHIRSNVLFEREEYADAV